MGDFRVLTRDGGWREVDHPFLELKGADSRGIDYIRGAQLVRVADATPIVLKCAKELRLGLRDRPDFEWSFDGALEFLLKYDADSHPSLVELLRKYILKCGEVEPYVDDDSEGRVGIFGGGLYGDLQ